MAFPTLYAVAWNAEARWEDLFKNRIEHFRQSLSAVDLYDPDDSLLMKLCVQQASQRRHNRGSVVNDAVAVRTLLRLHEMAAGSDTRIRFFTTTDSLQSAFFTPEVLDKLGETSTHAEWNKGGRVSEHFPLRSASYFLLRCAVPELRFTHDQSQSTTRQRALLRLVSKRLDTLTELLKARDQQDQVWEFLDTCEIGRKRISNLITETQSVGIHQSATEESAGRLIKNLSESQKRRPLTKIYESSSGRSKTIARVAQHQLDVFDDSMVMAREFTETIALLMKQPDESINRALAKLIPMTRPGKEELNRLIEELLPERDFVSTFFIGEADQEISAKVVEYAERMLPGFVSMREEISEDGIRVRFELVRDLYRTSGDPEQVVMWTGLLHYLGYEQAALQFVRQAYESWRLAGKEHLWTPELEILERVLTIDSWARRPSLTLAKIDEERSWTVDLVRKHRRETTSQAAAMYLWAIASTKTVVHEVSLRESNKIKSELFRDVLEILETFSLNGIGYTSYNAAYLAVSADMQLRLKHRDALAKRPIEGALNAKIREYRQLIREARGNQKDSARVEALDARCDLQRWVPALEATSEIVRKHYIATELDQVADVKNHIEVIQRHAIESRWDKLCNELAHVVAEMDNALNALNALLR